MTVIVVSILDLPALNKLSLRRDRVFATCYPVRWGRLRLKTLAFNVPEAFRVERITISAAGQAVEASQVQKGQRVEVTLAREVLLGEEQTLEASLTRIT